MKKNRTKSSSIFCTRRTTVKAVVATGSAVLWAKPIINTVILPAHAQTSGVIVDPLPNPNPCAATGTLTSGAARATRVISYTDNPLVQDRSDDPTQALGSPDYDGNASNNNPEEFVSIGEPGDTLVLGFNSGVAISNSGNGSNDIGIIEIGALEPVTIRLRPVPSSDTASLLASQGALSQDTGGFFEIGTVPGGTSALNIDAATLNAFPAGRLVFDQMKLVSTTSGPTNNGGDIDAVSVFTFYQGCTF